MQRSILTFILLLTFYFPFSQNIMVRKSTKPSPIARKEFDFIEPITDTTTLKFVSTIRSTGKSDGSIESLYYDILDKAKTDGANCFKLSSYSRNDSLNEITLILDTYFGNDSILNINLANHENNAICIFGDENPGNNKTYSFKINGEKKTIKSGTFYKQIIKAGEEIKINKGGFTGMTIWIKYQENKRATFLTLTGLGLGGGPVPYGTIGVSVNTGRLDQVPGDLGYLLINILKQSE